MQVHIGPRLEGCIICRTLETTYTGDSIDVLLLDPDFLVFHYEKLDIVDFQITIPLQFDTHKYIYAIVIKWDADFQYFSGFYRIDKPS
ncbi:unnamed protein product [marine sediment metagenome]|uniref:Uncharacterized protein n=1 Tax=marine sediment metagenome TaxID=412755 RepID=X1DKE4_9ZZZZ